MIGLIGNKDSVCRALNYSKQLQEVFESFARCTNQSLMNNKNNSMEYLLSIPISQEIQKEKDTNFDIALSFLI